MEMKQTLVGRMVLVMELWFGEGRQRENAHESKAKDGREDEFLSSRELDGPDDGHRKEEDQEVGDCHPSAHPPTINTHP